MIRNQRFQSSGVLLDWCQDSGISLGKRQAVQIFPSRRRRLQIFLHHIKGHIQGKNEIRVVGFHYRMLRHSMKAKQMRQRIVNTYHRTQQWTVQWLSAALRWPPDWIPFQWQELRIFQCHVVAFKILLLSCGHGYRFQGYSELISWIERRYDWATRENCRFKKSQKTWKEALALTGAKNLDFASLLWS